MKKTSNLVPLTAAAGGAAAFGLRLLQNRTGFEPDTGLSIPGNVPALALAALWVLLAAALFAESRKLPADAGEAADFCRYFGAGTGGARYGVVLANAGAMLLAAGGAGQVLKALGSTAIVTADGMTYMLASSGPSRKEYLLLGFLALASAVGLFPAAVGCMKPLKKPLPPSLLLLPPVCMVVRLVLTYRIHSVSPVVQGYYIQILALVLIALGFYRLSGFAFQAGNLRIFAVYAGLALALNMGFAADLPEEEELLVYLGSALVLLGFLLVRLQRPELPAEPEPQKEA